MWDKVISRNVRSDSPLLPNWPEVVALDLLKGRRRGGCFIRVTIAGKGVARSAEVDECTS
jgi:hypothetical protein